MICVTHAHPYLSRWRTNRVLADALRGAENLDFRALYDLYPDFDIDVAAEQRALEQAGLLMNAIDEVADRLALADRVREHFPGLPMIARACNVTHYVELRTRGVTVVERETFESALRTGRRVPETLGVDRFRAREMADAFRRHNVTTMEALIPHFHDEARVLSEAKAGREELREFFARDRARFETEERNGWKAD